MDTKRRVELQTEDAEVQGCKLQGTENLTIVQLQRQHGNGLNQWVCNLIYEVQQSATSYVVLRFREGFSVILNVAIARERKPTRGVVPKWFKGVVLKTIRRDKRAEVQILSTPPHSCLIASSLSRAAQPTCVDRLASSVRFCKAIYMQI